MTNRQACHQCAIRIGPVISTNYIFKRRLEMEYKSNIFGEQVFCGWFHGIVEESFTVGLSHHSDSHRTGLFQFVGLDYRSNYSDI